MYSHVQTVASSQNVSKSDQRTATKRRGSEQEEGRVYRSDCHEERVLVWKRRPSADDVRDHYVRRFVLCPEFVPFSAASCNTKLPKFVISYQV